MPPRRPEVKDGVFGEDVVEQFEFAAVDLARREARGDHVVVVRVARVQVCDLSSVEQLFGPQSLHGRVI